MTAVETLSSFDDNDRMALAGMLRDAVENGASVGYVMPIDEEDPGRLCTSDGKAT